MVAPRTLFALFALLLTATHCVEIDDRDLEVTDGNGNDDGTGGGTGTSCEPDADDNACTLCTKDVCCDEITSCDENVDCVYFADCWFACDDDACVDSCVEQYPDGALDFANFLDCAYGECTDACS
jgi:hypothetical protein